MDALVKGIFSIYETPQGGVHIALRLDGEDEDRHMDFPRAMVKMASMAGGGIDPLAKLRGMSASATAL